MSLKRIPEGERRTIEQLRGHYEIHLHPDDAIDQLQGIYNALVPGGIYICITPHRFTGSHDISKYFDDVATGFHLKEYINKELYRLFKSVGFSKIQSYPGAKGIYVKFLIYPAIMIEYLLDHFHISVRRKISKVLLLKNLLEIRLIAIKNSEKIKKGKKNEKKYKSFC